MWDVRCTNCGIVIRGENHDAIAFGLTKDMMRPGDRFCPDCGFAVRSCATPPALDEIKYFLVNEGQLGPPVYVLNMNSAFVASQAVSYAQATGMYKQKYGGRNVAPTGRYGNRGGRGGVVPPLRHQNYGGATAQVTTQTQCTITWDHPTQAYVINTPYNPNFLEFIKARIPGAKRNWDPVAKVWRVEEDYMDVVRMLAEELWTPEAVKVIHKDEVEAAIAAQAKQMREAMLSQLPQKERTVFEFVEFLSLDALKAAYRKAAIELHPDKNANDGSKMARLNEVWTRVEKEFEEKK